MLSAYGQQKIWHQYTLEDGLPSMNTWSILQADDGLLWFSSDKGICSFDGYAFHQPVDTSVYKGMAAFFPAVDPGGRVWFSRMDETIWYVEADTIRAWKFNAVLDRFRKDFFLISQIAFDANGDIWLHAGMLGFVVVDSIGNCRIIRNTANGNLLFGTVGNQLVCGFQDESQPNRQNGFPDVDFTLLEKTGMKKTGSSRVKRPDDLSLFSSIGRHEGTIYLMCGGRIYSWDQDLFQPIGETGIPKSRMAVSGKGQFAFTCEDVGQAGLYYCPAPKDVKQGNRINILPDTRTHYAFFDREGGLWVSTLDEGLYYCKDPDTDLYNLSGKLKTKDVFVLAFDGDRQIYAGVETRAFAIDIITGRASPLSPTDLVDSWTALYFDTVKREVWASSKLAVFRQKAWQPILYYSQTSLGKQGVNAKTIAASPDGKRLWMSSTFGFYEMELATLQVRYHKGDSLPERNTRTYAVLEDDSGTIWVATIEGLKCWRNGRYETPPFRHESLRFNTSSLLLLSDGTIVIGSNGGGILLYQKKEPVLHIGTGQGLTSDHITTLRKGANSVFFACTDHGLNIIQLDPGRHYRIRSISRLHGLPSDIIHDVVEIGDDFWIATDKGLVHWRDQKNQVTISSPEIKDLLVNQKRAEPLPNLVLRHDQNHLEVFFHVTSFRSEGRVMYRYRLLGSDTSFKTTTSRSVDFPELPSGHYRFEVQARREDGTWTESTFLDFTISPPWYKRWWFISGCLGALASGGFILLRAKAKAFREKTEVSLKMKELELAALRAQINPHFIFNCLGSIQQYIASNDPESASRYLARFAKLVRLSLHSSVDGKHSLSDEIAMLDSYLCLEQMRFKGKFSYHIGLSDELDPEAVFLPPMVLQPFVENAVLHGIKGAKEEGRITVDFSRADRSLRIVITDNGPGMPKGESGGSTGHKSFGMSLTHRRLDLMAGGKDAAAISTHNRLDMEGRVVGFEVIVEIPIE